MAGIFRPLRADEIECRVATVTEKGCSILLYKDARCDQNILDETVGQYYWQRDHKEIKGNMYAGIGIRDPETGEWIWKWDCGTESYTEKEKGEASDSFKRAGFNWGIGRELYTAPFIWFKAADINLQDKAGKKTTYDTFELQDIAYEDGRIVALTVMDRKTKALWKMGDASRKVTQAEARVIKTMLEEAGQDVSGFLRYYKVKAVEDMTAAMYVHASKTLNCMIDGRNNAFNPA
jgi:hypothetical protein